MSFAAAASRLSGLVEGSFEGIEVLQRGSSPRIVSADVLGSKGRTLVSGPELAARLGLYSTWAYFSVKSSHGVARRAGRERPGRRATPVPAPTAQPASVNGQGGSRRPGRTSRTAGERRRPGRRGGRIDQARPELTRGGSARWT